MYDFHTLLRDKFGMEAFRPGQLEAMQALLEHNRLLCIQPTGYGKSLLYQLPSCLLGGLTLVVSPLLALMRDQIDQLTHRFHISAASINSDQTEEENGIARSKVLAGQLQILFTSPEQLDHIDRFDFLLHLPINLLVIDEAHCISTWGHDFRPSYRCILQFCRALKEARPQLKILGLTATADARVEKDIAGQLSSAPESVFVWREKMDRPNIHLSVIPVEGMAAKLALCEALLSKIAGTGLIYCSTRENAEIVADYLQSRGLSIIAYHAGLESEEKRKIQEAFSQNSFRVIAATTALGMGIDKKDLRFIIHFDVPGSITAYYQEVGRCGRDGLKAEGILLYDSADKKVQDYFIDSALPTEENFQEVLSTVGSAAEPPHMTAIKRLTGLHPTRVTIVLAELLEQHFLRKESIKGTQVYFLDQKEQTLDLSRYTTQYQVKTEELAKILSYAEQRTDCRMALLRHALGDPSATGCGRCDVCQSSSPPALPDASAAQLWLSMRPIPIAGARTSSISPGLSLLDGKMRTPIFSRFMRQRAETEETDPEIVKLLIKQADTLPKPIGAIVPIPSKTWKAQLAYAKALAEHFNVPCLSDLLMWQTEPEKRQGELLNNDQRHYNVHEKMKVQLFATVPEGALILFDDYIGSGATIKEAARCLRKTYTNPFIPLTIAAVKWRLGQPGFI